MGYWGAGARVVQPGGSEGLHPLNSAPRSLGLGVWAPGGSGSDPPAPLRDWGVPGWVSGSEWADMARHGGYQPHVLLRVWGPRGRGLCTGLTVTVRWEQDRLLREYRNRARPVRDRGSAAAHGVRERGPGPGTAAATGDPRTGHGGCYQGPQDRYSGYSGTPAPDTAAVPDTPRPAPVAATGNVGTGHSG